MWDIAKHTDDRIILEYSWPQRHLYHVTGTILGYDVDCYVWSDCPDDACASVQEYTGTEGEDDTDLTVRELDGELYEAIKATTDAALAALE